MPLFVVYLVTRHGSQHVWYGDVKSAQDALRHARESGIQYNGHFVVTTEQKDPLRDKWIQTTTEFQGDRLITTADSVLELAPQMVELPTIEETLAWLARDKNVAVQQTVAEHPLTPTTTRQI